ncbi:unnamed protein product [Brachionus calyciflorus]|uniref:BEN domain-containing protein n=1 Tax=Brachionus calyciflorus TaxID=104777 RepID=A0A814P4T3_9BILA|nr:unnamed protein product [Brachionus calyciflorus]
MKKSRIQKKCDKKCKKYIDRQTTEKKSSNDILIDDCNEISVENSTISNSDCDDIKKLKADLEELKTDISDIKSMLSQVLHNQNNCNQNTIPTELVFNGINLLSITASSMSKYITTLMDRLYSKKELRKSYVIEGSSNSKRLPLDLERLKAIKNAVFIKYRVPEDKKE